MEVTTQIYDVECSVCRKHSDHAIIKNSANPGAPDLDMRPNEPHRSSMEYWVMECPHCGYCNGMLITRAEFDHEYLKSDEYLNLGGIETDNVLAARFIKKALVNIKNNNLKEAVQSYLYAAWVFDDEKNNENARLCRLAGVKVMDENADAFSNDDNFQILKIDLLRRSGDFDRIIQEYDGKQYKNIVHSVIAEFQVRFARKMDSSAHNIDEIPGITKRSKRK